LIGPLDLLEPSTDYSQYLISQNMSFRTDTFESDQECHGHDDEELALLSPSVETAFDVPNAEWKRNRKLTIAGVAFACLVLLGVYLQPKPTSVSSVMSLYYDKIGKLADGTPVVAVATTLPHDVKIFSGSFSIRSDRLPRISKESSKPVDSVESLTKDPALYPSVLSASSASSSTSPISLEAQAVAALASVSPAADGTHPISAVSSAGGLLLCTLTAQIKSKAYVAPEGCAMISDVDLAYTKNTHKSGNVLVICAPQSVGTFPLDSETLESFGLVNSGKSLISSVVPGEKTEAVLYTGKYFDGSTYTMRPEKSIPLNQLMLNDNVNSVIFKSTTDAQPSSCKALKAQIGFIEHPSSVR
jgi:hypothetical protein